MTPLSELENYASFSGQTQIPAWYTAPVSRAGWIPASIPSSAGQPPAVDNLAMDHNSLVRYTSLSCFIDAGLLLLGS